MKQLYTIIFAIIGFLFARNAVAQVHEPSYMLRVHEDNDVLNIFGATTDRSYTNGTRIEFFQSSRSERPGLLHRVLPTAGEGSINVSGWGITQLMVTPEDISTSEYQHDDYRYAGSLFVTHSLHSFNPVRKFNYQSELLIGIRGPHALTKQTQKSIHALMNYEEPGGWHNQLNTKFLFNLTFTAEKNLFLWKDVVEMNGGAQARVGTLMDAVLIYPTLRIGKFSPYFNGLLSQYGSYAQDEKNNKMQYYLTVKTTASFVAYNAMLRGTHLNVEGANLNEVSPLPIAHYVGDVQFGAVIAYRNMAISYVLTRTSTYDKGLYEHRFGTVEICVSW